jgi:hypothetical protein
VRHSHDPPSSNTTLALANTVSTHKHTYDRIRRRPYLLHMHSFMPTDTRSPTPSNLCSPKSAGVHEAKWLPPWLHVPAHAMLSCDLKCQHAGQCGWLHMRSFAMMGSCMPCHATSCSWKLHANLKPTLASTPTRPLTSQCPLDPLSNNSPKGID